MLMNSLYYIADYMSHPYALLPITIDPQGLLGPSASSFLRNTLLPPSTSSQSPFIKFST